MNAPFPISPRLTAIALSYRNSVFIADGVLPRVPVDSPKFIYSKFDVADSFTVPDTRVGRKSAPNEIDWTGTEVNASVEDYGLDDLIPKRDVMAAEAGATIQGVTPIDPEARSTLLLTDLVALDRERRVAGQVFNVANYTNNQTLSGTAQWSDFTNSDPLNDILTALDAPLIRPNVAVFGQPVWSKLRQHPKITAAVYPGGGNAGSGGAAVSRQAIADLLELDEVLIGPSWYNTAKPGQTASLGRIWGKHASFIYRAPQIMDTQNTVTFGFTAEWGSRIAGVVGDDPKVGLHGATRMRVGESVAEVIAAPDAGYMFQNAVL